MKVHMKLIYYVSLLSCEFTVSPLYRSLFEGGGDRERTDPLRGNGQRTIGSLSDKYTPCTYK